MGHFVCCVENCYNSGRNSKCKFYRFPTAQWKLDQREKWISAINRKNPDGTAWCPKPWDLICSEHFIGGKKSAEIASPSYVPTIFPSPCASRSKASPTTDMSEKGDVREDTTGAVTTEHMLEIEIKPAERMSEGEANPASTASAVSTTNTTSTASTVGTVKAGAVECRACLRLFDSPSNVYVLEGAILESWVALTNIEISEDDEITRTICKSCRANLYTAHKFLYQVQRSDEILRKRHSVEGAAPGGGGNDIVWPKPIQLDKNVNENILGNADVVIKQEILSEEEYDNQEDYSDSAVLNIKIEPEEMSVDDVGDSETSVNIGNTPEEEPMPILLNGVISLSNKEVQSASESCPSPHYITNGTHTDDLLQVQVKSEPLSEDEEAGVAQECLLCSKKLNSISGLKAHVIAQHSYKSVKRKSSNTPTPEKKPKTDKHVCATCRRSFATSTDLMVHETCHNKWSCYSCRVQLDTWAQLAAHRRACTLPPARSADLKTLHHVQRPPQSQPPAKSEDSPSEQSKDSLTCVKCDETFTEVYYLRIHEEVHHAEAEPAPEPPMNVEALDETMLSDF